jgi:ribosomal protein L24E
LHLFNVTLSGNTASSEGPALYIVQGSAVINRSAINGNAAQSGGGALYVKGGGKLLLVNSTFERNIAGKGREAFGGVMHVTDSTVMITECKFTNNFATQGAGAIYVGLANQPDATQKCQYDDLPMRLEVRGSNFSGNVAPTGGALAVYYAAVLINNSTFQDNRARPVQVSAHVCLTTAF